MGEGEDWLMRPVVEGLCLYESLLDGRIDLEAISRMNAALDVKQENQRRLDKANE
jgi:hypothetical protein